MPNNAVVALVSASKSACLFMSAHNLRAASYSARVGDTCAVRRKYSETNQQPPAPQILEGPTRTAADPIGKPIQTRTPQHLPHRLTSSQSLPIPHLRTTTRND